MGLEKSLPGWGNSKGKSTRSEWAWRRAFQAGGTAGQIHEVGVGLVCGKEKREGGEVGGDEVREAIKRARSPRESKQTVARGHTWPATCFVNSFIGTLPGSFDLPAIYGYFQTATAELSSCDRDHSAYKA